MENITEKVENKLSGGFDKSNEMCFGFGKHKGQKVTDILEKEPGYFGWVLNADFPRYTKKVLTEIRLKTMNTKG